MPERHCLFDWGDTLMVDHPGQAGPMCDWPEGSLVDGAAECLRDLSRVARCHLATNARNSDAASIRSALRRAGIDELLEKIYCFREVGHLKPSPAYFEHIVTDLGCPPADIVMVGDSLEMDILGAMHCGLQAVWYNPSAKPAPAGVTTVTSLRDLVEYTRA